MPGFWDTLVSVQNFMPHGHCYLWKPGLVWLEVLSNTLIGLAYVAIATTLTYLVYRVRDIPFQIIYLAFGAFIITCGFTHFMDVVTIWTPLYWLDGGLRAITAVASVGTAILLPFLVPKAIALAKGTRVAHLRGLRLETAYQQLGEVVQKAKELDELKTHFFANVSHELRTPLALILGPVERMSKAENLTPDQRHSLEVISRNAQTLLKHVNDLLDVAKLEASKINPQYVKTDLPQLIRIVTANFDGIARERQISLVINAPSTLPVELDSKLIQRVILNLLSNAFKFVPERGSIEVTVEKKGSSAEFSVADSGPGIPENMREVIFERFRQIEGDATRQHGGTGLGLSIVREFINLHHGTIRVEKAPIGGALFKVEIPLKAPPGTDVHLPTSVPLKEEITQQIRAATPQNQTRKEPQIPGPRGVILLVEDNSDMNHFLAQILSEEYQVVSAFNGREGLEKTYGFHPDLILTDIMMPIMSGDQMVFQIRKNPDFDGIPIILLTAKADDDLKNRLLREGAQDFIIKPFSSEEVLTRVRNLVTIKKVRESLQQELQSQLHDLEMLAQEVGQRKQELQKMVSDLRIAKEEAERASSAKSVFLGLVSHELKTPITSLKLQLEMLKRIEGKNLTRRQLELVNKLDESSARSLEMMNTLLEYTRIQSGKIELIPENLDLVNLVNDSVEFLRPQAQISEKHLNLKLLPTPEIPTILSDRLLLQMVVRNLITNAIKYTETGDVLVRVSFENEEHRVSVKDTGPGIPKDLQELIFQPFRQLDPLEKKSQRGFGLGLAIARDSIQALGGRIELISILGQGSTFTAVFPPLTQFKGKKSGTKAA